LGLGLGLGPTPTPTPTPIRLLFGIIFIIRIKFRRNILVIFIYDFNIISLI